MVRAAAFAGADTVKVQMYTPGSLTLHSGHRRFRITEGPWSHKTLWELYEATCMPLDWVPLLKELAASMEIGFLATVYDPRMVDLAEEMGIDRYKVASFEINYLDLLNKLLYTNKHLLVSCGTAQEKAIGKVVELFGSRLTLLKCSSNYPAPPETLNLATIPDMAARYGVPVGFSDHTTGVTAPVTAAALGAKVIEKHLKIDDEGADATFSVSPSRFRLMVESVRYAEASIGEVSYVPTTSKYVRRWVDGQFVRTVC